LGHYAVAYIGGEASTAAKPLRILFRGFRQTGFGSAVTVTDEIRWASQLFSEQPISALTNESNLTSQLQKASRDPSRRRFYCGLGKIKCLSATDENAIDTT